MSPSCVYKQYINDTFMKGIENVLYTSEYCIYTHFSSSGRINLSALLAAPVRWQDKEIKWSGNSVISRKHSINIPIGICLSQNVVAITISLTKLSTCR